MSRIPGKGHSKLITAGLGWAAAEVILSRGLLLWFGARGAEFSWIYIQKCLESNISLVNCITLNWINKSIFIKKNFLQFYFVQIQHLTTATLLWLFTRHDLNAKYKPIVTLLLIATPFKAIWLDAVLKAAITGIWTTLAFKALATSSLGVLTLHIYAGLAQSIGI